MEGGLLRPGRLQAARSPMTAYTGGNDSDVGRPETSSLDPPPDPIQRGSRTRTPTLPCFTGHSRMHRIGVKRSSLQLEIYFDQRQRGLQSRWERVRAGISRRFLPSLNDISQQNLPSRDSTLLPLLCSFVIIGADATFMLTDRGPLYCAMSAEE